MSTNFSADYSMEKFGLTFNPGGYPEADLLKIPNQPAEARWFAGPTNGVVEVWQRLGRHRTQVERVESGSLERRPPQFLVFGEGHSRG